MSLNENEYDLNAEAERLTKEMEQAAEEQASAPSGSSAASRAASEGQTAQRFRTGVEWAMRELGTESITVGALTNGERHRVNDMADKGYKRSDAYVTAGVIDAPWIEHNPDAIVDAEFEDTIRNVVEFHPAFVDYLERKVTESSRAGHEGKSYRELVAENQTAEN